MLDESLPTYRLQTSPDDPLRAVLFFTHNGSEPAAAYLVQRPAPSSSRNQYALGLLDVQYPSVVYAEVLVRPEWTQPTLSAADVRATGSLPPAPVTPDSFAMSLYNPDLSVVVKQCQGHWNKSDSWEFEVLQRSFKVPSASRIDQEGGVAAPLAALAPSVIFRWKRDGRLSKDMTCYMSGRSVGGKKSKESDITIAMFRVAKSDGMVTIYEPNLARVDVEDHKGLELSLILSAEVIRDLYLVPRQDPFNAGGGSGPRKDSNPRPTATATTPASQLAFASGALGDMPPASSPPAGSSPPPRRDSRQQAEIDAETRRLQTMVAEETRRARQREKRDLEEQKRIRKMLEQEDKERRRREAEVEKETERLRKEYGVPALPPRPGGQGPSPRAKSVGPPAPGPHPGHGVRPPKPLANPLSMLLHGPLYGGPSGANASGFFHRSPDDERRDRVRKKRSVHF